MRHFAKASGSSGCQKPPSTSATQRCNSQLSGVAHRSAFQPRPPPRRPPRCSVRHSAAISPPVRRAPPS
jgi:hypothetical protein